MAGTTSKGSAARVAPQWYQAYIKLASPTLPAEMSQGREVYVRPHASDPNAFLVKLAAPKRGECVVAWTLSKAQCDGHIKTLRDAKGKPIPAPSE